MAFSTRGLSGIDEPIIPIEPQYEEEDFVTVELSNNYDENGVTIKKKHVTPKMTEAELELMLHAIVEFDEAVSESNLNCDADGPKLFALFRQVMVTSIRQQWDTSRANQPNTHAGFQASVDAFINHYIKTSDYADQKRYLDTCKKPLDMTCKEFDERLKYINRLMSMLPGANNTNPYDENGLKIVFYNAMPLKWRLKFLDAGVELEDITYDRLVQRMSNMEAAANAARRLETQRKKKLPGKKATSPKKGKTPGNNPGKSTAGKKKGGQCPFKGHEGHDWVDCFGNPDGPNYKPGFKLPDVRVGGKKPKSKSTDEANLVEETEDAHFNQNNGTSPKKRKGRRGGGGKKKKQKKTATQGQEEESHWLDDYLPDE